MTDVPGIDTLIGLLGVPFEDPRFSFLPPGPPGDQFSVGDFRGIHLGDDAKGYTLAFALGGGLATVALDLSGDDCVWRGGLPLGAMRQSAVTDFDALLGAPDFSGKGDFETICDARAWRRAEAVWIALYLVNGQAIGLEYGLPLSCDGLSP